MTCTYDPTKDNKGLGMFHCPDCGEMVLAGVAHPIGIFTKEFDEMCEYYDKMREELENNVR